MRHFEVKIYFDKWLKDNNDGKCKICEKETQWSGGFKDTYKKTCGKIKCSKKWNNIRSKERCLELFGVINNFQRFECIKKIKQTKKERYGYENYNNIEKHQQTCLKRYGVKNTFQSEEKKIKIKQTTKDKYGAENNMQSEKGKNEFKESMLKNHGIEWSMQSKEIHEKQQKSAKLLKYFKNTKLYYRGSYEEDFLDKYYSLFSNIINAKSIKYLFEEKQHVYHPDFYISSLNLIVEIKNSYLAKRDKLKIEAKEKATIANGFNYIIIIDKDYNMFKSFLINQGISNL
jgi:hypothetical protein